MTKTPPGELLPYHCLLIVGSSKNAILEVAALEVVLIYLSSNRFIASSFFLTDSFNFFVSLVDSSYSKTLNWNKNFFNLMSNERQFGKIMRRANCFTTVWITCDGAHLWHSLIYFSSNRRSQNCSIFMLISQISILFHIKCMVIFIPGLKLINDALLFADACLKFVSFAYRTFQPENGEAFACH